MVQILFLYLVVLSFINSCWMLYYAAYFVAGTDIGKFTMKTVDDIRTVNKSVHFRPTSNLCNINELASLWEKKIGRTLPRVIVTENDLLTAAAGAIHLIISFFIHGLNYFKVPFFFFFFSDHTGLSIISIFYNQHQLCLILSLFYICSELHTSKYCSIFHS